MGHRADLLAGAKRCLYEKGYARTTARDIVAASGTNLGSIGYHYGSTEALMQAAMLSAIEDWGDVLGAALAADGPDEPADPLVRYWQRVIGSMRWVTEAMRALTAEKNRRTGPRRCSAWLGCETMMSTRSSSALAWASATAGTSATWEQSSRAAPIARACFMPLTPAIRLPHIT